ncbi:helix-turn-helix domain-containing protein [Citrobacter braakii]|uniref:helix-turn-helix domain-containing protein n=1 Tax=Citrobacter braakii TaxID=57706 RepID=UPI00142B968E|nr:AraC family transcriptional regulator [Citrobacter braakii]ECX2002447.1 helix-turn-helix transcriptional regulator [Salmonella enterica subsp. enterica serovar Newport]MBJ9048989.1 helix-turn-helix transcriptional regulator [Citrobacter braakii]
MDNNETFFIKQVSTGVYDDNIKNIESSLPFFFLIYSNDKPFHISFDGKIFLINKGMAVFIKKSVPFSVLLNWGWAENGLVRKDIVSLKIPQEAIGEYIKLCLSKDWEEIKNTVPNDYVILNYSEENNHDFSLINSLIESIPVSNTKNHLYNVDNAKYILILSLIQKLAPELEGMIISCSSLTTSEKVASLIMRDYSKNWKSKEIASQLNMSVSTFKKKMYQDIGSVSNFITKVKMIEALRQLRRTHLPINTIALSLGYTSPSYFTSVFKKHFNLFPSEIRKQNDDLT